MMNNTNMKIPKKYQPFLRSLAFLEGEYTLIARNGFGFSNQGSVMIVNRQKDITKALSSLSPNKEIGSRKEIVTMLLADVSLEQNETEIKLGVFHPDVEQISERDFLKVLEMVVGVTESKTQEANFSDYWVEVNCRKSCKGAVVSISIKEE